MAGKPHQSLPPEGGGFAVGKDGRSSSRKETPPPLRGAPSGREPWRKSATVCVGVEIKFYQNLVGATIGRPY